MAVDSHDPTGVPGQVDLEPGSPDPVVNADPSARVARLARGTRPLSDTELARRQQALTCAIVEPDDAGAGCTQALHLSVFFDGTGNNRDQEMRKPADRRAVLLPLGRGEGHDELCQRLFELSAGRPMLSFIGARSSPEAMVQHLRSHLEARVGPATYLVRYADTRTQMHWTPTSVGASSKALRPEAFQVHLYPEGRVEVAMGKAWERPRLDLP